MIFRPFYRFETGCAGYVVGCGGLGTCAVVDPHLEDVAAYEAFARTKEMKVAVVIETHIHADHRSGGQELAQRAGSRYALHRSAPLAMPFEPLDDGQRIELGNVAVDVLHTPGHSPESLCLVVADRRRGDFPWMVLTGDTLFSGAVGRPDLPGQAEKSAAELHGSLARLLALPDTVEVYPAHFGGSACGAGMNGKPMTTIGFERRMNPLLGLPRDEFVRRVTEAIPPRPVAMDDIVRANRGTES